MAKKKDLVSTSQLSLALEVAAEREVNGIGMGVLRNGTPYLTQRGLARMCGVEDSNIVRMAADWQLEPLKPREAKVRELVRTQGVDDSIAFIAVHKAGTVYHAVPSAVCMAVLEYYAFEAKGGNEHAANSYRVLARKGFNDFIYAQVGYNPTGESGIAWQQFHDRVSLNYHTVPDGYFSIFKEIADMFVTLIRGGAQLGPSFLPDISVGQLWGKFWTGENLEILYGARLKYEHNYPLYFPQAASNPQHPYCYPNEALAEFRQWVKQEYVAKRMPIYLGQKVQEGKIPAPAAQAALEAFKPVKVLPTKI